MSTNAQEVLAQESSPELLLELPEENVIISQNELIEKVKQWQSHFSSDTERFNEEETNLGLSRWRIHCALTGTYQEYEKILKQVQSADLERRLSPAVHEAFKTFINNTQPQKAARSVDVLFKRDLTDHNQFDGVISEEELKATLVTYLTLNSGEQEGVGLTLGCNEYSVTLTRVGNRIQVIDSANGVPISLELPQRGTPAANAVELKSAVTILFENVLTKSLHLNEEEMSTYHNFRLHAYSRLHHPTSSSAQTLYPSPLALVTSIYETRKDTLDQQDEHSKTNALVSAVQNGNRELVLFLERALGKEKCDSCKKQAFETAVVHGQFEYVDRYYQKEYVSQDMMHQAYSSGDEAVVNLFLDKGHRFEKNEFEKALAKAAAEQGNAFNLLIQYYNKYHRAQPDLINPSQLITAHRSPLLNIAAENNHVEAMRLLLANDVNLSLRDEAGKNCLHFLSLNQSELFIDIVSRNPDLLFMKDAKGKHPVDRLYKTKGVNGELLSEKICNVLIHKGKKEQWYEAYLLALVHDNERLISQCREHIPFSEMLRHEGDSRTVTGNRFVDICEHDADLFIETLKGVDLTKQTKETLHDIYLLALRHDKLDLIKSILAVSAFDPNTLFKDGPIVSSFPWYYLPENPEIFDFLVENVDIRKIDDPKSLTEYYLIALHLKKMDLCKEISSHIADKSALFLKGPHSEKDPYTFFEENADIFNRFAAAINLEGSFDSLNPEALNQIYKLALMHNNHQIYVKCIEKLKTDATFSRSTDDLDVCYQSKNTALFKELFALKSVSEEWCKKNVIKALRAENYEIAAVLLERFPQIVNAQIDSINRVPQYPLWIAINENNVKRCQFLLEHNADPYLKRPNMLTMTLMKEGLNRAPLRELFSSYAQFQQEKVRVMEEQITRMQDKFAGVLKQLKEHKDWKLPKKYGFWGIDEQNVIKLTGDKPADKKYLPIGLSKIVEIINNTKSERSLPQLEKYIDDLTKCIQLMDEKVLPSSLKQKLIEIVTSSNATHAAIELPKVEATASFREFIDSMKKEQESDVRYRLQ